MFLNRLTFLNTCGGLKLSGKIMLDDRGAVEFEFAAHTRAKRPIQVAIWVEDLILRRASFNYRRMANWRLKEQSRKLPGSNEDLRYLRLIDLKSGLLSFDDQDVASA